MYDSTGVKQSRHCANEVSKLQGVCVYSPGPTEWQTKRSENKREIKWIEIFQIRLDMWLRVINGSVLDRIRPPLTWIAGVKKNKTMQGRRGRRNRRNVRCPDMDHLRRFMNAMNGCMNECAFWHETKDWSSLREVWLELNLKLAKLNHDWVAVGSKSPNELQSICAAFWGAI